MPRWWAVVGLCLGAAALAVEPGPGFRDMLALWDGVEASLAQPPAAAKGD